MALAEGHIPTSGLIEAPPLEATLSARYNNDYPAALVHAGLVGVNLVERFPVLNIMYGYTRGGGDAAESRLIPFRHPRGGYRLYGDLSETEALYFPPRPDQSSGMAQRTRSHTARLASIPTRIHAKPGSLSWRAAEIPPPGDEPAVPSVGSELLTLIHSYAHRVIRRTSVFAGIDRDALAEYLVPINLGFFIYAGARGDFVLGGLQAMFETELDALLANVVYGEHRCALDPGCYTRSRCLLGMSARRRAKLSLLQHLPGSQVTIR